jgi:CubicO group peptidase (beta-lactamase class C family)
MKKYFTFLILLTLLGLSACTTKNSSSPDSLSTYSTPEQEGISSASILAFIQALEETQPDALHSLMIRRHGRIVAQGWWEPYSAETPHLLWSLSKSFTSTAIGIAQDEGLLSINDQVISFFPEDVREDASDNLKAMRIKDLLRMNTGHAVEPGFRSLQSDNWVRAFLEHPVDFKPGTHFLYNSMATYMCSAIIQKVSGMSTLDYLTPRLFEPLGINKPTWESCPRGISVGGWGLSLTTEDIGKFGQLLLQKGQWNGQQLVSEAWVEEATSIQTSNGSNPDSDWDQGYGYQFWQCRYGAYRGDGAFGQYCIVMPGQDAVLAITSGSGDMQGILNAVWDHLLPAMKEEALPADEETLGGLNQKLQQLSISLVEGEQSSDLIPDISGKTFTFDPPELAFKQIMFDFQSSPNEVTLTTEQGEQRIQVGYGKRVSGTWPSPFLESHKVAVDGAWTAPDTYTLNLVYYETPETVKLKFSFKGDSLIMDTRRRASFGPRQEGQLIATMNE